MIPLQRAGHACALPDPGDKDAQMHLCQCGWLSIFSMILPSFYPLLCALWEFSPSQEIINVLEHLPHCVSWHVCACCQVFFCKDSLFA